MQYISFVQLVFLSTYCGPAPFLDAWDPSLRKTDKDAQRGGTDTVAGPQPRVHQVVVSVRRGKGRVDDWQLGGDGRGGDGGCHYKQVVREVWLRR